MMLTTGLVIGIVKALQYCADKLNEENSSNTSSYSAGNSSFRQTSCSSNSYSSSTSLTNTSSEKKLNGLKNG